ncbi:MAG: fused MFS/spermidine synthase [Selenomonadaceae bacterium]|nr:fused MFS/spermidine synthase [Selenomonadaceae bacterium]
MEMTSPLLRNKNFLYATEFFSGMSIMAVELGASRLLAPYFSSSQIVWTIIIGTIMIALALGNVWGGRRADVDANPAKLYRRLIIAALWIGAIPVLGKFIILAIAGTLIVAIDTDLLIWAAFLSCMAIFVLPLFLLGTVTPSLVKYATDNLEHNGRIVGNLNAFNTIGSIIGTFLPTFVTIPTVGTAITFMIFSGILLSIGIIYFVSIGAKKFFCTVVVIIFVVCGIIGNSVGFAFWEKNLLYEGESIYNYLQVKDTPNKIIFSTNVLFGVQSLKVKNDELTGMYYDYALAAPLVVDKKNLRVLILGMGTGTFAEQCRKYFPSAQITGVEIDEKITLLARQYFALPEDIEVITYDGRAFLEADKNIYDVILVDAFQDISPPFQMSSAEFFRLIGNHLDDNGVMVVNMNMRASGAGNINEYLIDTIGTVFPAVRTIDAVGITNRVLFAAADNSTLDELKTCAENLPKGKLSRLMLSIADGWQAPVFGENILTDDCAPVELLSMRALDSIIQNHLHYYKEIYKRDGLDGIINNF